MCRKRLHRPASLFLSRLAGVIVSIKEPVLFAQLGTGMGIVPKALNFPPHLDVGHRHHPCSYASSHVVMYFCCIVLHATAAEPLLWASFSRAVQEARELMSTFWSGFLLWLMFGLFPVTRGPQDPGRHPPF